MTNRVRKAFLAAGLSAALLTGASATPAIASAPTQPVPGNFFRLLPLSAPPRVTLQQLADLASSMLDPNAPEGDNPGIPSGFTYTGQFLDHDLTLDASPVPTDTEDPTQVPNGRTFAFDLDSVYGGGPVGSPQFYDARGRFLLVTNAFGVLDVPRTVAGTAIINEARNDENRIINQIQLAFMLAHNRLINAGLSFTDARKTLVTFYKQAILADFLPHIVGPVATPTLVRLVVKTLQAHGTPVEFSVAAYRFGHSIVRKAYVLNETSGKVQVFTPTGPDLRGGSPLPAKLVIDWSEFFPDLPNVDTDGNPTNVSRKIDTLISSGLFSLPIPGAEATGSNVLAFRNLQRGMFYDLPSGETVARALGVPVVPVDAGFGFTPGNTPLWYYILAEAQAQTGGTKLGAVGSAIVKAGFISALINERLPGRASASAEQVLLGPDHKATISDIFVFAGVAKR